MATYTENNARDRIWSLLRDYGQNLTEQLLGDAEVLSIGVRGAEPIYSRIRPLVKISDKVADGSHYLTLPTDWVEGFSTIESLESPPDEVPPEVLDPRSYYVGRNSTGALRLVLNDAPANGATVRIAYTVMRIFASSANNTTALDADFVAICDLGASICADSIAAKYARTSESAFNTDAINYRTRTQEWQSVAKRLWARWEVGIGIGSGGEGMGAAPAASAWANWDSVASWGGSRINHPRIGR
jgi:hypothetical protein